MAFDLGNGLSAAGTAVAATAGAYTLESQKADLENQKIQLADALAGKRESAGRQEQGMINATAADKAETFQGGQNDLNRASEEKRTKMSSDATLGSAATSAAASRYTADMHLKASENYASSRLEVAQVTADAKKAVADMTAKAKADAKAASGLSDDALNTAAMVYNATGAMPSGYGMQNQRVAIMNKAQELATASGLSSTDLMDTKARASAAKPALAAVEKNGALVTSFSEAAGMNGKVALELLDKGAGPSGVPVLDRYLQAGRKDIQGDPDVSRLHAALETYKTETAKVLSGATGAAGITDSARDHVDGLFNTASTPAQIKGVMEVLNMERLNRIKSIDDQKRVLIEAMGGKAAGPQSTAATPSNPAGTTLSAPPAAPPAASSAPESKRLSPEEAERLPAGTPFIGEDGVPRVRH